MELKHILISIQTFNGLKYTKKVLKSIREQDYDQGYGHRQLHLLHFFIIDNYSTDGTIEFLQENNIDHQIMNPRQCSAKGMNICLKKFYNSDYDYLILLNNDIYLEKDFINNIIDDFEEQNRIKPGCLLMCGVQNPPNITDKQFDAIIKMEIQDIDDEVMPGDFSAFIINKETIKKIGYFDERFIPRYIEDNDYTRRIYLSGNYVVRNGRCTFHHEGGQVNKLMKENPLEILKRNSELFKEKWGEYQKGSDRIGL